MIYDIIAISHTNVNYITPLEFLSHAHRLQFTCSHLLVIPVKYLMDCFLLPRYIEMYSIIMVASFPQVPIVLVVVDS